MSYDLYLRKRDGRFDEAAVLDWFRGRPLYQVESRQAIYSSADTGVYSVFDLRSSSDEDYDVHFYLNYFRPSYFVLEAEPEVTALVRTFDFIVTDPQINGMGEDHYDGQGLIASWTRSLEVTLPGFLRDPATRQNLHTLPTTRLAEIWRWNHGRRALQEEIGDHFFVPRILFLRIDGQTQTAIVWGDGIPMLLPKVDLIVVHRQQLAPWRLFGRRPNQALMSWADMTALVEPCTTPHASGALLLTYDQPPKPLADRLRSLPTLTVKPGVLAADAVLDREMVERALAVQQ